MSLVWNAEDVLRAVRGKSLHEQNWIANGVAIDSRTVKPGDLFVALKGPKYDAHDYVGAAIAAGAVGAIIEHIPSQVPADAPLLQVDDSFAALQDLGRVGRARARSTILAVTGSVGKTSTKDQLRLMLEAVSTTYASEGSLNNHWGVPLSLARLPADTRYGVFELGMNHKGEMETLTREVMPHVALITNIEAVHLEFFASLETIADAKAEIFLGMNADGIAVLNRDNPYYARLLAAARTQGLRRTLGFGKDSRSEARLLSYEGHDNESTVRAEVLGTKLHYKIGAIGVHLALNSVGALLAAGAVGLDLPTCAEALAFYKPPQGRGTRQRIKLESGGTFTMIDESFNASPVATRNAISLLGETPTGPGGRRFAVLGDMRELGIGAADLHASLAKDLVVAKIDKVFCCGDMMRVLYDALPPSLRGFWTPSSEELAPVMATSVQGGDVIMVKGSKSMLMPKVIGALKALEGSTEKQKIAS